MFDSFYDFLDKIGYLHPIHPAMTHMPIGLVVGSLFLGTAGWLSNRPALARSAYFTLVLAFLFWFPTIVFGLMDWQRYYGGAWLHSIKLKLILASLLFLLLMVGVLLGYRDQTRIKRLLPIYVLCFMNVTALGYFGGQLVYGGRTPGASVEFRTGQRLFDSNCSGCHAHGGNAILPNYPLRNAPVLEKLDDFRKFIRDPRVPSGAKGPMPAFPPAKISDSQVSDLYDYIVHAIENPSRN
jgi:uncharacterized membrane protein